jgi:hypothetical protein
MHMQPGEQAILGRWDADALRDIVRDYVIEHLADDDAVLVIDETGFLKQGKGRITDKEYLQRRKYLSNLPEADEGQPIPLDDQVVSHAIGETLFCCASLMGAVDEWLATN